MSAFAGSWVALFTRWGEGQILLPLMLLTAGAWALQPAGRRPALLWLGGTAAAVVIVLATKLAFFGFGWGYAPWRYTGFSGHAMFAFAAWPVWAALAAAAWRPAAVSGQAMAVGLGVLAAAAVGGSRLVLGAHSLADVVLGGLAGAAASGLALQALWRGHRGTAASVQGWAGPRRRALGAVLLAVGVALCWLPQVAPPARTHGWVLHWSTVLSGRATPYSLQDLLLRSP